MIGRFNPAGLLAGRPDVQKQAMMAQQQPETRQGLLGRTRGVIGGLLGGIGNQIERGQTEDEGFNLFRFRPPEGMNQSDMIAMGTAGLMDAFVPQMGGNRLAMQSQMTGQRMDARAQQQAMQQQQEQMAQFRASLPPEQQQLFDMNPEGFLTQMTQAEFRAPNFQAFGEDIFRTDRGLEQVGQVSRGPTDAIRTLEELSNRPDLMAAEERRRRAGASRTNVNVQPAVPDREDVLSIDGDFVTVRDPESPAGVRRIPIPGSPTATRQRMSEDERVAQDAARFRNFMRTSGTAIQDINRSLEQVSDNPRLVGAIGSGLANVPETEQRVIRERMRSVAGNIGVEEIIGFREQGGTLGAIPMAQQVAFQQLRGTIDQDLPFDEWMQNAMRLNNLYMDMMFPDGVPEDAPYYELPFDQYGRAREFSQNNPARPRTNIEMAILPAGTFYIDPDDGQLYRKRGR
jgi:hypothetical protein